MQSSDLYPVRPFIWRRFATFIRNPMPRAALRPSIVRAIALLTLAGAAALPAPSLAASLPMEGTMAVETKSIDGEQPAAPDMFRDAAASALADKGFTLLDGSDHAAFTMELAISVTDVGTGDAKVATTGAKVLNGGVAGAVGSSVRIAVPSGKSRLVPLERTQLEMTLRKRGGTDVVWRGTAVTVRSAATRGNIAPDLCNALLRQYPAQPEAVIGVP